MPRCLVSRTETPYVVRMSEPSWAAAVSAAVGQRVADVRRERGMSVRELSDQLTALGHPVNRSSLSQLELGNRGVSLPDLLAIATALDVSPVLLLVDPESRQPSVPFVPGLEDAVSAGHLVNWWSGIAPVTTTDDGFANWKRQMRSFSDWQAYEEAVHDLAIRAYLENTFSSNEGSDADHQVLVDASTAQFKVARELASRLPWADLGRDLSEVYRAQSAARQIHLDGTGWLLQTRSGNGDPSTEEA